MNPIQELIQALPQKKKILITTHVRPDADALGSSLGLYHFLKQKKHECLLVLPTAYAYINKWFPGIKESIVYDDKKELVDQFLERCDLVIVVDFNQLSRNGALGSQILQSKKTTLLIDHHTYPEAVFDYRIWDTRFSAAAEGVFHFIEMYDSSYLSDQTIAQCLYGAIIADSGSFRHSGVSPDTHKIAARLLESGINHNLIHQKVFDNFNESRLRLWGYCLSQKLEIHEKYPLAIMTLSLEEFESHKGVAGDTEGLVNFPLSIEEIDVSVFITEKKDEVKLSFRSKNTAVNTFASEYFNGGGHVNAAGGESHESLADTVALLYKNLDKLFNY